MEDVELDNFFSQINWSDACDKPAAGLALTSASCSSSSAATSVCTTDQYDENTSMSTDNTDVDIDFLRQKQALLRRASYAMRRDEEYDASIARDMVTQQTGVDEEPSAIFIEAKEILYEMDSNTRDKSKGALALEKNQRQTERQTEEDVVPVKVQMCSIEKSPIHPMIDISSVTCVSSKYFSIQNVNNAWTVTGEEELYLPSHVTSI